MRSRDYSTDSCTAGGRRQSTGATPCELRKVFASENGWQSALWSLRSPAFSRAIG